MFGFFQIGPISMWVVGIHVILQVWPIAANIFGSWFGSPSWNISVFKGIYCLCINLAGTRCIQWKEERLQVLRLQCQMLLHNKPVLPTLTINLLHGWNMISSNNQSQNNAMSSIWNNIDSNLFLIIKDGSGDFLVPRSKRLLNKLERF